MYKIREAAKLLNVETVEIHKKLISLKKELSLHVHKKNGIIHIDQKGIDIISLSFAGVKSDLSHGSKNTENENDIKDNNDVIDNEKNNAGFDDDLDYDISEGINLASDNEEDLLNLKAEINYKKNELNTLNQKIISELERTSNYTNELVELQQKIKEYLA